MDACVLLGKSKLKKVLGFDILTRYRLFLTRVTWPFIVSFCKAK
jgi:hypothetical protein